MMNSIRASPTPSLGRAAILKARSGFPRLIMIRVRGREMSPTSVVSTENGISPAIIKAIDAPEMPSTSGSKSSSAEKTQAMI